MRTPWPAALVVLALAPAAAPAQPERYELGRRLKLFEAACEKQTDADARKRALAILPNVTRQFFAFRFGEAGRALDDARLALRSNDPPSDAERWAAALSLEPEGRILDSSAKAVTVTLKAFYPVKAGPPKNAAVRFRIATGGWVDVPVGKLPATAAVPFPVEGYEGDWPLAWQVMSDGKPVHAGDLKVTTLHRFKDRAEVLRELGRNPVRGRKGVAASPIGIELATVKDRVE